MKKMIKDDDKKKDDLFGLLSMYKSNNTYFKVLMSEAEDSVVLIISDNPKNWHNLKEEKYQGYRALKRLEIGCRKFFIKFISPFHLIKVLGPGLNFNIPLNKIKIIDNLEEKVYYLLDVQLKYKEKFFDGINRLLNMNPHKKYEIIEKFIAKSQE